MEAIHLSQCHYWSMVQIGVELHRIPELGGILLFQDWDILDTKEYTKPRLKYFPIEKAETY